MALSRAEEPQFGRDREMPFSSSPITLQTGEFRSTRHFLVLGKDRDTLACVTTAYPNITRVEGFTLDERGKLRRISTIVSEGESAPVGNYALSLARVINQKEVSVVAHYSEKLVPEPLERRGDNPTRILKRLRRRHERWERSRKN